MIRRGMSFVDRGIQFVLMGGISWRIWGMGVMRKRQPSFWLMLLGFLLRKSW